MKASLLLLSAAIGAALFAPGVFAGDTMVSPDVAAKVHATGLRSTGRYDRFIVTYRNGTTERTKTGNAPMGSTWKRKLAIGSDLVRTPHRLDANEARAFMSQVASDPNVTHVEPDLMMHAVRDIVGAVMPAAALAGPPNDPNYAIYQWHLRAGDGTAEKIGNDATAFANRGGSNASDAWTIADGTGVTVAVLDTGITHHADIPTSLTSESYDFINDGFVSGRGVDGRVAGAWDTGDWTNTEPYITECEDGGTGEASSWHGTHVTGTVAEHTGNGVGMAGVAPGAQILPVRVLGHCGGYTSDIADAIVWSSGGHVDGIPDNTHPAQVLSMSLGGAGTCGADSVTAQAIAGAIARGASVVVAAGNDGSDVAGHAPASCPGVIAVASVGITGKRAFYSNYGNGVTIAAPGGGIFANDASSGSQVAAGFVWSAINLGQTVEDQSGYGAMAGTSQATPHVAGTVALMLSAAHDAGHSALTPDQVRQALLYSARAFPSRPDQPIGVGIVDAAAAVQAAIASDTPVEATVLTSGVSITGRSGAAASSTLYRIDVPVGTRNLSIRTLGGTGNVSLFARRGNAPSTDGGNADLSSVKAGNNESIVQNSPAAGTWYISVVGVTAYTGVTVLGTTTAP